MHLLRNAQTAAQKKNKLSFPLCNFSCLVCCNLDEHTVTLKVEEETEITLHHWGFPRKIRPAVTFERMVLLKQKAVITFIHED